MQKSKSGFTIVELLIVIVVIAILATISIAAYNSIQQRARDAERTQDTAAIQKVLELYYVDHSYFPTHTQMQDPDWRRANFATSDQGIFINPQSASDTNSMNAAGSAVTVKSYSYYAVDGSGSSANCIASPTTCTGYRMAWRLEVSPDTLQSRAVNR